DADLEARTRRRLFDRRSKGLAIARHDRPHSRDPFRCSAHEAAEDAREARDLLRPAAGKDANERLALRDAPLAAKLRGARGIVVAVQLIRERMADVANLRRASSVELLLERQDRQQKVGVAKDLAAPPRSPC